jgi:uncharacterized protein YecT (DUF1311 family)
MRSTLLALALLAGAAQADDLFDNPDCKPLAKLAVPAADQPDAAALAQLEACDSESLYYADGGKPDYVAARRCAYAERAKGNEVQFGGSGVLMMLYANAQGVARNVELAKKFACEYDGAPAELEGRLRHLDEMAKESSPAPLDICDDITSGYMMGFCASRGADAANVKRDSQHAALSKGWSEADRAAFAKLRTAADAYFDAVVDGEVDMSGTARGALAVGARETLEDGLAASLEKFEKGDLPRGDTEGFTAADKALNAAYAAAMKAAKPIEGEDFSNLGSVKPEGIRAAERAWIKYRDAWVAFGAHKYPAVSADAWRTYFTRERTEALKALSGE